MNPESIFIAQSNLDAVISVAIGIALLVCGYYFSNKNK